MTRKETRKEKRKRRRRDTEEPVPAQESTVTAEDAPRRTRKERVLHTRVSEGLEEELKKRASDLGLSVSNLVRNVLSNTIDMVEEIVEDSSRVASSARGIGDEFKSGRPRVGWVSPASGTAPSSAPLILGWQELVLALNAVCDRCNAILARGTNAAVAIFDGPAPRTFLCTDCLEKLQQEQENEDA